MTLLPKSTRQFLFVFLNLLKMPFGFLLRAIVLCLQELDVLLGAQRFPLLQPLNAETACLSLRTCSSVISGVLPWTFAVQPRTIDGVLSSAAPC